MCCLFITFTSGMKIFSCLLNENLLINCRLLLGLFEFPGNRYPRLECSPINHCDFTRKLLEGIVSSCLHRFGRIRNGFSNASVKWFRPDAQEAGKKKSGLQIGTFWISIAKFGIRTSRNQFSSKLLLALTLNPS